jgi:outer membrane lipoprotein carrier protein
MTNWGMNDRRIFDVLRMEVGMRAAVIFVPFLLILLAPDAGAKDPTAGQVAEKIQKFYKATQDFQAAFQQEYFSKALDRKKRSSGFVYIKKPGMMRWDYKEPRPKHFVADGKALYIYDPELEQVMVDRTFSGSSLTTAVTFLWGQGRLADEFTIAFYGRGDLGGPQHYVLQMLPKKKARFKKLIMVVDQQTFRVTETVVEDPGGNVNHIFFANISTNVGLSDESFHFKIPEGIDVIEAPKPGRSP